MLAALAMGGLMAGAATRVSAMTVAPSSPEQTAATRVAKSIGGFNAGRLAINPDGPKKEKSTCKGKDGCPAADDAKTDKSKQDAGKTGDTSSGDKSAKQGSTK